MMTSKNTGCPLLSIFQQWTALSQSQRIENGTHRSSFSCSYSVLLQSAYSLEARITAAEPSENPHLYRRAKIATPPERAFRDIYGASERAWLLRLIEVSVQNQRRQKIKKFGSVDHKTDTGGSVIFVQTKIRSKHYFLLEELPEELRREVKVIDALPHDTFESDRRRISVDEEHSNKKNLRELLKRLKDELNRASTNKAPAIFIWQSLTPLIVVHGFQNTLRLLRAFRGCLQVWPVNLQVTTPKQLAQLEDASNSILYLNSGEMNMIKQGIRERGNVLRQPLLFRLEPITSDTNKQRRFRVVEKAEDQNGGLDHRNDHYTSEVGENRNREMKRSNTTTVENSESNESSNKFRGIHLHLEESDGVRNGSNGGKLSSEIEVPSPARPRIYLQDDDPEFDDFDEEDPDDDLDI